MDHFHESAEFALTLRHVWPETLRRGQLVLGDIQPIENRCFHNGARAGLA